MRFARLESPTFRFLNRGYAISATAIQMPCVQKLGRESRIYLMPLIRDVALFILFIHLMLALPCVTILYCLLLLVNNIKMAADPVSTERVSAFNDFVVVGRLAYNRVLLVCC